MARDNLDARAREIVRIAEECGVRDNPFFDDTLKIYESQQRKLEALDKSIEESGLLVTKEYVKGRCNLYTNPALAEYNRTADSRHKTLAALEKVLRQFGEGVQDAEEDPLMNVINGGDEAE